MPALIEVNVEDDFDKLSKGLTRLEREQLPYAAARALTDTAKLAQGGYRQRLPSIFDRPTPYTMNSSRVQPARKDNLEASVELRDFAAKGTPAAKYLGPEIEGGARNVKRFERALALAGIRSPSGFAVPGRGASLDQYGNMSRGQIVQILSQLNAMADRTQNVSARTTAKLARKGLLARHGKRLAPGQYFLATSKRDGEPLGIYKLVGRGRVEPVMIFPRRAPRYTMRLDFYGLMEKSYRANFGRLLAEWLEKAVATAR